MYFLFQINVYNDKFQSRFRESDFILAALNEMEKFGVQEDIEIYKALLDIFPKGKYIPDNYFLADAWYHPEQLDCGLEILTKMEYYGILM